MAWSDAARAAAREARKAHASAAKTYRDIPYGSSYGLHHLADASERKFMAGKLRDYRRNGAPKVTSHQTYSSAKFAMHSRALTPSRLASQAALSTAVRNSLRRR